MTTNLSAWTLFRKSGGDKKNIHVFFFFSHQKTSLLKHRADSCLHWGSQDILEHVYLKRANVSQLKSWQVFLVQWCEITKEPLCSIKYFHAQSHIMPRFYSDSTKLTVPLTFCRTWCFSGVNLLYVIVCLWMMQQMPFTAGIIFSWTPFFTPSMSQALHKTVVFIKEVIYY